MKTFNSLQRGKKKMKDKKKIQFVAAVETEDENKESNELRQEFDAINIGL